MADTAAGWKTEETTDDEVHVHPLEDLVDHVLDEDMCICGPWVECIPREDARDGWMYTHHALDGRD